MEVLYGAVLVLLTFLLCGMLDQREVEPVGVEVEEE